MSHIGDRVQWPLALQRLNKDALYAQAQLLETTLLRLVAAFMGRAWGAATDIAYDTTAFDGSSGTKTLGIGRALFIAVTNWGETSGDTPDEPLGRVVYYDPDAPWQADTGITGLDITAGSTKYLAFTRGEVAYDDALERYIDAGAKTSDTVAGRYREVVTFTAITESDFELYYETLAPSGVFVFAKVEWSGNIPTITTIPFTDGPAFVNAQDVILGLGTNTSGGIGVVPQLRALMAQLYMLIDSDWAVNSVGNVITQGDAITLPVAVPQGMRQLDEAVSQFGDALDIDTGLAMTTVAAGVVETAASGEGVLILGRKNPNYVTVLGLVTAALKTANSDGTLLSNGLNDTGIVSLRLQHATTVPPAEMVFGLGILEQPNATVTLIEHVATETFSPGPSGMPETWVHFRITRNLTGATGVQASFEIKAAV